MHIGRIIVLATIVCMPLTSFAAGFAKQSLFLSKSPVTEGDSVLIHSVVQNDADISFNGSLVVFAQETSGEKQRVGTVSVSIAPSGANTVSVSWKPLAGTYTVTAELTKIDGTVVETQTARFAINEKPKPASSEAVIIEENSEVAPSDDLQKQLSSFSPSAARVGEPVFKTIDSLRTQTGRLLDQGMSWSKSKVGSKNPGEVLGESTKDLSPVGLFGSAQNIAAVVILYLFSALKWIIANPAICYPVIAIAFLYGLWRLFVRFRRPSYY